MPRRILYPNSFYHIYNRGNRKCKIFLSQNDFARFANTIFRIKKDYNFVLYSYCLMPNHFHLLIFSGSKPEELSKYMHRISTSYSKYFNKKYNLVGSTFQRPFHARYVTKDRGFQLVSNYIRNNPVKAGMVSDAQYYRWYLECSLSLEEKNY